VARPIRDPLAAERARDFVELHLWEPMSLDEVASAAGVSRFHVVRLFRRNFGLTPFRYRRLLRLRQARERLQAGWPDL
jgi:AraC-like DNA-binding protein